MKLCSGRRQLLQRHVKPGGDLPEALLVSRGPLRRGTRFVGVDIGAPGRRRFRRDGTTWKARGHDSVPHLGRGDPTGRTVVDIVTALDLI